MRLATRLKRARKFAKLTQSGLEERSGVSQKTISKIERGDQETSSQVVQLAGACGVDPKWLATGQGIEPGADAPALHVNEARANYQGLTPEQLDIARVWAKLPPGRRKAFHDMMFFEAVVGAVYPWLLSAHPSSESYAEFESRVLRDIKRRTHKAAHHD